MQYLVMLKGGKCLVNDKGTVKVAEVSFPYPDCSYNGVYGSDNIFNTLGLTYTSSGHKEDSIREVLAGRNEMPIDEFITVAKSFSKERNVVQNEHHKEESEKVELQDRSHLVSILSDYFDVDSINALCDNLQSIDLSLKHVMNEVDTFLMLSLNLKISSADQVDCMLNRFKKILTPIRGTFTIYKDVYSSLAGKSSCIILYSLKDDLDIDDLLFWQYNLEHSIYEIMNNPYRYDNINCKVERVKDGELITFSYTEGNEEYGEHDNNDFLQYTRFKEN